MSLVLLADLCVTSSETRFSSAGRGGGVSSLDGGVHGGGAMVGGGPGGGATTAARDDGDDIDTPLTGVGAATDGAGALTPAGGRELIRGGVAAARATADGRATLASEARRRGDNCDCAVLLLERGVALARRMSPAPSERGDRRGERRGDLTLG